MAPKISIIVPVFQIEESILRHSLDSMVQQTMDDIEIIVIDDGSKDDSLINISNYRKKYPNKIFLISKPNGGISDALNYGMKLTRGPYIAFVCGDDWISPDFCEKMYKKAISEKADVVISSSSNVRSITESSVQIIRPSKEVLKDKYELIKTARATMGDKLFSKRLFDRYGFDVFPLGVVYEDGYSSPVLLSYIDRFAIESEVTHFHLDRIDGTTANIKKTIFPRILDIVKISNMLYLFATSELKRDWDVQKYHALIYRAVSCVEYGAEFVYKHSPDESLRANMIRYLEEVKILLPNWNKYESDNLVACPSRMKSMIEAVTRGDADALLSYVKKR